eukprot:CFRG4308T1
MTLSVDCFFVNVGRREAIALLRSHGEKCSYLIRESQSVPGSYVLTFRVDPFIRNFTIVVQKGEDGNKRYHIGNRSFASIEDVLHHYHRHPLSDDLCLRDPVTIHMVQQADRSPARTPHGTTVTTHTSRIRCYDYPSAAMTPPTEPASNSTSRNGHANGSNGSRKQRSRSISESSTLAQLMLDDQQRQMFRQFLEMGHVEEGLMFLDAVNAYKEVLTSNMTVPDVSQVAVNKAHAMSKDLFVKYMTPASMYEVDLTMSTVREVRKNLEKLHTMGNLNTQYKKLLILFDTAYEAILTSLRTEHFPRFKEWRATQAEGDTDIF